MDLKAGKRRIMITLSLICSGWLILGAYLYMINQPPFLPVTHAFDAKTGAITFMIDPEYSIDHIVLSEGTYYAQPVFDSETTEISFYAFDLPAGQHESVYFVCNRRDGEADQAGVEFEIQHSDGEVLIQVFENGRDFPGYRRMDTYRY